MSTKDPRDMLVACKRAMEEAARAQAQVISTDWTAMIASIDALLAAPEVSPGQQTFEQWWFKEETVDALERARTVQDECRIAWNGALAAVSAPEQPSAQGEAVAEQMRAIAADFPDKLFTGFSNLMEGAKKRGSLEDVAYIKSLRDLFSEVVRAFVHRTTPQPSACAQTTSASLVWTAPKKPTQEVPYDHCTAFTPFGRFLITWKGWKDNDWPTVDETPWGEFFGSWPNLDAAKKACEFEHSRRLGMVTIPKPPKGFEDFGLVLWDGKPHAATDTVWIQPGGVTK